LILGKKALRNYYDLINYGLDNDPMSPINKANIVIGIINKNNIQIIDEITMTEITISTFILIKFQILNNIIKIIKAKEKTKLINKSISNIID